MGLDPLSWDGNGTGTFVLGRERNGNVCLGTGTERERLSWDGNVLLGRAWDCRQGNSSLLGVKQSSTRS